MAFNLAPLNMTIQVNGVHATQLMLDGIEQRGGNIEPYLRSMEVQHQLEASANRRMESYPFRPVTLRWRARKREEGLDPRTMHASNRLAQALERTTSDVRIDAQRTTLTWGIRKNSDLWVRTHVQAKRGRRAVVIDATAEQNIALGIVKYIAYGRIRGAVIGLAATAIPGVPPPP
jgi:hypothetical protein